MSVEQQAICIPPRIDVFFDDELRKNKNVNIIPFIHDKIVISYLPTHRSMGKKKIACSEIMNLKEIQKNCKEHNAVFLIKKHNFHIGEKEDLSQYDCIMDITNDSIDTQTLLFQTDVLITDFSACMVDYSILDRPIIFFGYDLEYFIKEERKLYIPFGSDNAGYIAHNSSDLSTAISNVLNDLKDKRHSQGRKILRERYFGSTNDFGHSRKDIHHIIKEMINGTYKNEWQK